MVENCEKMKKNVVESVRQVVLPVILTLIIADNMLLCGLISAADWKTAHSDCEKLVCNTKTLTI